VVRSGFPEKEIFLGAGTPKVQGTGAPIRRWSREPHSQGVKKKAGVSWGPSVLISPREATKLGGVPLYIPKNESM
jgi:hypothetical protein